MFAWIRKKQQPRPCRLRIGPSMDDLRPADGVDWQTKMDALLREGPDIVICLSDDEGDLDMVRDAIRYLSGIGGEVGIAPQLRDEEVAAMFGVDVATYQSVVVNPRGAAGGCVASA